MSTIDNNLLKVAIAEARIATEERLRNTPTIHVVVADTLEKAREFKKDHHCSRCYDKVRHFSPKSSLRGQSFNGVNYVHVLTDNPEVWRDIVMIIKSSPEFYGPIWTYFQRK